jgi:two-component system sensor histidine kinase/response regulator
VTAFQVGTDMESMAHETESNKNILVIDDELGLREGCRRALSRYGYRVDVAATGKEGLAKVRSGDFEVVLIDVMMPDISGIELLAEIRAHKPDTICIIITGYATVELAVDAMKQGAYDFLAKPFSDDLLLLAIEKGLEKRELQREARRVQEMEAEARRLNREKAMLEELDRVKSGFMRKVAHELRAPLAAIRSFLTLILQGYTTPEKAKELQERAGERADDLLALIDDLLNLARLKDVKYVARTDTVSFDSVLQDVLGLHASEAEGKGLRLTVKVQPCPPILADPAHVKQLWTNLISNAIKYTPKGGQIWVRLSSDDGHIVGEVTDTGIGISKEDQVHLFEEFFRTEQAKEVAQHGTGLGLSIVKQIVEELGGDLTVESDIGRGATFTFRLPVTSQGRVSS